MYFGRQNQQNLQINWTWLVRKKEAVKDNAKDFAMSKWVNGIAIYSTGKEGKWHRFGRSQEFALGMIHWHAWQPFTWRCGIDS